MIQAEHAPRPLGSRRVLPRIRSNIPVLSPPPNCPCLISRPSPPLCELCDSVTSPEMGLLIVNRLPYLLYRRILTSVDICNKPQIWTPVFFKYSIYIRDNCTVRFIFLRGFRKYTNMTSYDVLLPSYNYVNFASKRNC